MIFVVYIQGENNIMKKSKIIVPALGLIALSTAASITGTVAWFTANNSVTITGMTFKTQVGNNLLVADDQDAAFTDEEFESSLQQSRFARLEPVSTINANSFFYTTVSNDDGSAKSTSPFYAYSEAANLDNTAAAKDKHDANFNSRYVGGVINTSNVVYGYVDYTFYLKATFSAVGDKIVMDKCQLKYDSSGSGTSYGNLGANDKAWRIGVLAHEASATTNAGATNVTPYTTAWDVSAADKDLKTILAPSGAAYQTSDTATTDAEKPDGVNGLGATRGDGNAPTYADVLNYGAGAVVYTTNAANESNKVFKVVVRLWIEGEDTKCFVDNYKALTNNYSLEVGFKTEAAGTSPSAAVTNIAPTVA